MRDWLLACGGAVLFAVFTVAPGAAADDIAAKLKFEDEKATLPFYLAHRKPWQPDEQETVLRLFRELQASVPGLIQRATAFRPIRLFRVVQDAGLRSVLATAYSFEGMIVFADSAFDSDTGMGLKETIAHESVHLIDIGYVISSSSEWTHLVGPRVERVRAVLKRADVPPFFDGQSPEDDAAIGSRFHDVAVREGLPRLYAVSKPSETLAVYVEAFVDGEQIPPDVKKFIDDKLLLPVTQLDPLLTGMNAAIDAKLDEAIELYTTMLAKSPGLADIYRRRARLWDYKGERDRAADDWDKALAAYEEFPSMQFDIYRDRASTWPKDEQEKTLADLAAAIELIPNNPDTYVVRARLWEEAGEYERAIEDCTTAIGKAPHYHEAFSIRAKSWEKLGDVEKAERDYTNMIRAYPEDRSGYVARADIRLEKRDYWGAVADLSQGIRLKPKMNLDDNLKRGQTRALLKDYQGAIEDYDRCHFLLHPFLEVVMYRGQAYVDMGEYEKGLKDLKWAWGGLNPTRKRMLGPEITPRIEKAERELGITPEE